MQSSRHESEPFRLGPALQELPVHLRRLSDPGGQVDGGLRAPGVDAARGRMVNSGARCAGMRMPRGHAVFEGSHGDRHLASQWGLAPSHSLTPPLSTWVHSCAPGLQCSPLSLSPHGSARSRAWWGRGTPAPRPHSAVSGPSVRAGPLVIRHPHQVIFQVGKQAGRREAGVGGQGVPSVTWPVKLPRALLILSSDQPEENRKTP